MELRAISNSTQLRHCNDRRVKTGSSVVRCPRRGGSLVGRVAVDDFNGPTPDSDGSFESSELVNAVDQTTRRRLEMTKSLLKEDYGVGTLVTAGVIKGVCQISDIFKKLNHDISILQGRFVQRYGALKKPSKSQDPMPGTNIHETFKTAISSSVASLMTWNKGITIDLEENDQMNKTTDSDCFEKEGLVKQEEAVGEIKHVFQVQDSVKQEEAVINSGDGFQVQDPVSGEFLFQGKLDSNTTNEATKVVSVTEEVATVNIKNKDNSKEDNKLEVEATVVTSVDEKEHDDSALESVSFSPDCTQESNNIETFSKTLENTKPLAKDEVSTSVAVNLAREILEEIANFEIETGQSVDLDPLDTTSPKQHPTTKETKPKTKQEIKQETKQEMKQKIEQKTKQKKDQESKSRLQTMKKRSTVKRSQRKKTVNVVKPSEKEKMRIQSTVSSSPVGLKGLDYIKSYTKDGSSNGGQDGNCDNPVSEMNSAFFKPPSILQDGSQVHNTSGSIMNGNGGWNETERQQRVREIGSILQRSRGGGGGGGFGKGNGGSGGGGGGGGRGNDESSNEDSNGNSLWIQIGFSTFAMTLFVFASLTAISNHFEKQKSPLKRYP
eukprot:g549.t1